MLQPRLVAISAALVFLACSGNRGASKGSEASEGGAEVAESGVESGLQPDASASPSSEGSVGTSDAVPFAARCSAPGVFRCIGFDNDSDFVESGGPPSQTVYPDATGSFANVIKDCGVAADGCSLRFTIPMANAVANCSGKYEYDFVRDSQQFGQSSTFYVQVRMRISPELAMYKYGGEGWKQVLIYGGETSCSSLGLVTQNVWYDGFPTMFHDCSPGFYTTVGGTEDVEQGDYNCAYGNYNPTDCADYQVGTWMTYYWKIHIGTWGQPDTSVEAWVANGSGPMKKWIDQLTFAMNYQNGPGDVLDKVALTPYTTDRMLTDAAPADGLLWFDELIASSQPIPAPNGATP